MLQYTTCTLCEATCGLQVEVDAGELIAIRGDAADPFSKGHICPKAVALRDIQQDPDRIRRPLRRRGSDWEPISWDRALDEVAERVHHIRKAYGPDAAGTYLGNPMAHNYAGTLAALMLRDALRSRNHYSASSADQLPHMFAALMMFGHQALLPVPDIDRTELLVVIGANPAVSNGSLMTAPGVADRLKALRRRGGRLLVIDPRRTETARLADHHYFIRPATDALLLASLIGVLAGEDRIDRGPWRAYTDGLATLEQVATRFPPERVAETVGLSAETIRHLAREIADAPSAAVYGRLGICTQRFGGLAAWLTYAINIVTGNLDRPGGVMFARPAVDLVGLASLLAQDGRYDRWRTRVTRLPEFSGEQPVSALAEEIETPGEGQLRALIVVAGNPVLSVPDGRRLERALGSLDLLVSVDFYLNETSRLAHLILPPVSPLERDHYPLLVYALAVRNAAKFSPRVLQPPPDAREDWQILAALSRRLLRLEGRVGSRLRGLGLGLMSRLGPRRWLDLALRAGPYGASARLLARLRRLESGQLRSGDDDHPSSAPPLSLRRLLATPHGIDLGPLRPCLPEGLRTPNEHVQLAPPMLLADLDRLARALEEGSLTPTDRLLLVGRRQLRSNNSWMHNTERLVRGRERCTLLVHPTDATSRGLEAGKTAIVKSSAGSVAAPIEVSEEIMPGIVSLPHGWGHQREGVRLTVARRLAGPSVNDVIDLGQVDTLTGNAGLNGVPVEVEPS